jgi:hypothetical protein
MLLPAGVMDEIEHSCGTMSTDVAAGWFSVFTAYASRLLAGNIVGALYHKL